MKINLGRLLAKAAPVIKTVAVAIVTREVAKRAAKTGAGAVVADVVVSALAKR